MKIRTYEIVTIILNAAILAAGLANLGINIANFAQN